MKTSTRVVLTLGFAATLAIAIGSADQQRSAAVARPSSAIKRQLVRAGNWQSERFGPEQRGWSAQIKQLDDDSLTGRITVVGSPRIRQARIEGQITGSDVYGVIVDDGGRQLGTFTGALYPNGMSGSYTTADGDSGNWSSEELGN